VTAAGAEGRAGCCDPGEASAIIDAPRNRLRSVKAVMATGCMRWYYLDMLVRGVCHVYLATNLGFTIDVTRAEHMLGRDQIAQNFRRPRLAPEPAQLQRHSFRVAQPGAQVQVGAFSTRAAVEITLWEFGAATFRYDIPVNHDLTELVALSDALWDHPQLLADARARATQLLSALGNAVDKPQVGERVEDYVAFELRLPADTAVSELWTSLASTTASILRAEPAELSQEEIADALSMRCAYLPNEVVLIDWFAALMVGDDMDDERLVIELSVAELLELRLLDEQLDHGIDAAYGVLTRKRGWLSSLSTRAKDLALVSQLQADAAVMFEGADNALKLVGDQYLARLYRIVSERFHLPQWDASIERKLSVLDGIYEKLAARASGRRVEMLEIMIVVLFAIDIVMPFLPWHAAK
jgi:hypothetical protein